jgi:CubicO group peptidase (beta-lactamase class C family)
MEGKTEAEKTALTVIDCWLSFSLPFFDVPGLQLSIRKKREVLFEKAYGYANTEEGKKFSSEHLCHLASHSKSLAACSTLILCQEGALDIGAPIADYLPWLKQHSDSRFKQITVQDLLAHRSGMCGNGREADYWELTSSFPNREALRKVILEDKLVYSPNTVTKYSNIGYGLLGLLLESVVDRSYGDIIEKTVFKKLGRNSFISDFLPHKITEFADGYSKKIYGGKRRAFKHVSANALASSTGLCGTASDLSLFFSNIMFGNELLSRQQKNLLLKTRWPVKNSISESYGMGMLFVDGGGRNYMGHSGGWPGFMSQTRLLSDEDYTVGLVLNASEDFTFSIAKSILATFSLIANTFSEKDPVCVSQVMMNWWGGAIYIVGSKKAICLNVGDWNFASNPTVLSKRKDGAFCSEKMSGSSSVGEPVLFFQKGKKINAVKFAAFTAKPVNEFMKISERSFLKT